MKRTIFRSLTAFAVVAVVALWHVDQAQAGRRGGSSGGSSGGSGGSWGSSGGYSYSSRGGLYHSSGGSGGSSGGGSWGSSGGSWGSSGGSWGGSYGSGGSSGGIADATYGSSGGSYGGYGYGYGSGGSAGVYSAPVHGGIAPAGGIEYGAPAEADGGMGGDLPMPEGEADDAAMLEVGVPRDAIVYVNGKRTRSTGRYRRYISRGLDEGYKYSYKVRAVATRNGRKIEETKSVEVRPGRRTRLAFALNPNQAPETTLTVNVPEGAKVTLSGNETESTGPVRRFTTKTLKHGAKWSNYIVKVSVEKDGRTLTKEQTITLNAGDTQTLTFDMETQLADAR